MKKFFKKALIITLCVCSVMGVSVAKANESEALGLVKYIRFYGKSGSSMDTKLSYLTAYNVTVYRANPAEGHYIYSLTYPTSKKYKGLPVYKYHHSVSEYYIKITGSVPGYSKLPDGYKKINACYVLPVRRVGKVNGKYVYVFDKQTAYPYYVDNKKYPFPYMVNDSQKLITRTTASAYIVGCPRGYNPKGRTYSPKAYNALNFVKNNVISRVKMIYKIV